MKEQKKNKIGQISIFIIISAILVILGIVIFTYNSDSLPIFTSDKSSYKVKKFVEECLSLETKNAVNQIGLHGGWLYTPLSNDHFYAKIDENKYTVQNKIGFDHFGTKIPYWYYYDDGGDEFEEKIPDYDTEDRYSLKNQIKRYLDENLERNCIQSFNSFKDVYKIKYEPREIKTKVVFDNDEIEVSLDLPLEINQINTQNSEYIDTFKATEFNELRIPYFLARDIINAEMNNSFIEEHILNVMSAYESTTDKSLLPPKYDFKMTFDKKPWKVADVERLSRQIISSNINILQFSQTSYTLRELSPELENNEFAKSFYSNYINEDILETYSLVKVEEPRIYREYRNYKVKPTYEVFYPMYFSLAPSFGDVVLFPKAEAYFNLLPFFTTEYVAVYEITTPILFEIKPNDQNSDFVFNLVMEANIDHNTPLKENYDFDLNLDEVNVESARNLICEPSQFISAPIYLNITDPINYGNRTHPNNPKVGVSNAYISFSCKNMATCYIGETEMNGEYISKNITQMALKLPINCNPGKLEIYKFGHKKVVFDNLNPTLDTPINLGEVPMYSKKKFELKVKLVSPGSTSIYSTGKALDEADSAFLILQNLEDSDIVEVVEANYDNQYNLSVELMPGRYSLEGFAIHNDNVTIPADEFCPDAEGGFLSAIFGGDEPECFDIPEINMESWVRGGLELEEFNLTQNDILRDKVITVVLIDFGIPRSYDELSAMSSYMSNLKSNSEGYRPYLD